MRLRYFFIFTACVLMVFSCSVLAFADSTVYTVPYNLSTSKEGLASRCLTCLPIYLSRAKYVTAVCSTSETVPLICAQYLDSDGYLKLLVYSGNSECSFNAGTYGYSTSGSYPSSFATFVNGGTLTLNSYTTVANYNSLAPSGYSNTYFYRVVSLGGNVSKDVSYGDWLDISSSDYFSNFDEAFSSCILAYSSNNPSSGGSGAVNRPSNIANTSSIVLNAGNLLFLEVDDTNSLSFTAETSFARYSSLFGAPWSDDNRYYFWTNSLPSSGDTFDFSNGGISFDWLKLNPTDLLGRTKYGYSSLDFSGSSSGSYLVIVNPYLQSQGSTSGLTGSNTIINNAITVYNLTGVSKVYTYAVSEQLVMYNGSPIVQNFSTVDYSNVYTGEVSPSGGAIVLTNSDGAVVSTPVGGTGQIVSVPDQYVEAINSSNAYIANGFENLASLLDVPRRFIGSIITPFNNFFSLFSGFFDWMPEEISTVWKSSVAILPVVGLVKMFF